MGRRQGTPLAGNQRPAGEHEIRFAANNRTNELLEEVRIVTSVGVKKCNNVIIIGVTEEVQTREARASIPRSRLIYHPCPVLASNVRGPVDRTIVHNDDSGGTGQGLQHVRQRQLVVLSRNQDVYA